MIELLSKEEWVSLITEYRLPYTEEYYDNHSHLETPNLYMTILAKIYENVFYREYIYNKFYNDIVINSIKYGKSVDDLIFDQYNDNITQYSFVGIEVDEKTPYELKENTKLRKTLLQLTKHYFDRYKTDERTAIIRKDIINMLHNPSSKYTLHDMRDFILRLKIDDNSNYIYRWHHILNMMSKLDRDVDIELEIEYRDYLDNTPYTFNYIKNKLDNEEMTDLCYSLNNIGLGLINELFLIRRVVK